MDFASAMNSLRFLRRNRRMDHHHEIGIVDRRHRRKVAHQHERLVGDQRLVGGVGVRHQEQRVAVGRRTRDRLGAQDRAGARTVLDHERLLERFGQVLAELAGKDIGRAAGRERHDDLDRPCRIGLRSRHRAGNGESQRQNRENAQKEISSECLQASDRPVDQDSASRGKKRAPDSRPPLHPFNPTAPCSPAARRPPARPAWPT